MYGSRFGELWRGGDPRRIREVWASALSGYSGNEIARGIAACREREWPPVLPEFLKLCRPSIDTEQGYLEAIAQLTRRRSGDDCWSHPAIFWAAVRLGSQDLLASNWANMKSRWTAALQKELERGSWPEIPPQRLALPEPGRTAIPPEEQRRRLAALRESLAQRPDDQQLITREKV